MPSIQGNFTEARGLWEQSYTITQADWRSLPNRRTAAQFGTGLADRAQFASALENVKEATLLFRELGLRQNLGMELNTQGSLLLRHGDIVQGQALCAESLAIRRAINDRNRSCASTCNVAVSYLLQGDYQTAKSLLQRR